MARMRTPDESPEAGWHAHFDEGHVPANVDDWERCSTKDTGCFHLVRNCDNFTQGIDDGPGDPTSIREYLFYDFDEGQTLTVGQRLPIAQPLKERSGLVGIGRFDLEHVAGPGCQNIGGYNGNNISLEEMRGCQTVQVLLPKGKNWQSLPDDLEAEVISNFHLTGIANCKGLILHPLVRCLTTLPARHGSNSVYLDLSADFHPWCFGIYLKLCRLRLGHVDLDHLMPFTEMKSTHLLMMNQILNCRENVSNRGFIFQAMNTDPFSLYTSHSTTDHEITPDRFSCFPTEIKHLILEYLNGKDIATLQLAFRQLPASIWYQQIQKDMPWLWEVWSDDAPYFWATVTPEDIWNNRLTRSPGGPDLPIWMSSSNIEGHTIYIPEHLSQWTYPKPPTKTTNWFVLYRDIKRNWNKMNGLRNRRRIWGLQEKMVEQMKEHIGEQALSAHSS